MIRIILISLLLAGCDSGNNGHGGGGSGGGGSGGGIVGSMASGFAAGAGAAAGHQAINHGIDKFKKYREGKANRGQNHIPERREKVINPRRTLSRPSGGSNRMARLKR